MVWYSDFALNEMGSFESQDVDRRGRSLHEVEKLYVCRKIQSVGRLGSFFGNAAGCAPREKVALAGNSREGLGSGAGGEQGERYIFHGDRGGLSRRIKRDTDPALVSSPKRATRLSDATDGREKRARLADLFS